MAKLDRWLLPDGVEELLPPLAQPVERLRNQLLHQFELWGYDQVIPPLVEFCSSLIIGTEDDLDVLTTRFTDQVTGRQMGVRADITPQAARIDAHSLKRQGPSRLCYVGTVVHSRQTGPLANRTPVQAGAELFGVNGLQGDVEVMSLLLHCLQEVGLSDVHLELGHVEIYRSLAEIAALPSEREAEYFDILQRKAAEELRCWVSEHVNDPKVQRWFTELPWLSGDVSVLARAKDLFNGAPAVLLQALDALEATVDQLSERFPSVKFYLDLGEVRGYHYHTGIVFAVFKEGLGSALANGGRYDAIGEVFGRSRAATGFSIDLLVLNRLVMVNEDRMSRIYAPALLDQALWQRVQELRSQGEKVVCGIEGVAPNFAELGCNRQLVKKGDDYVIENITGDA